MAYNAPFMGCTTADFASGERCSSTCRDGIKTVEQVVEMHASGHYQYSGSTNEHTGSADQYTGSADDGPINSSYNFHAPGFELNFKEHRLLHDNTHTATSASVEYCGHSTNSIHHNSFRQLDHNTTAEFDDVSIVDHID
ncbi:hypothetical protein Daus18300_010528 [Diaporthe australafricana]|uniref:Uncharacterized protein n=1 Tax=Diaporthe australafricana TaxID=127596 RepID=A0ABR3W9X3_9PEZI